MNLSLVDRALFAAFALTTVGYLVTILNVLVESGAIPADAGTNFSLTLPLGVLTALTMVWTIERVISETAVWDRVTTRLDEVRE